jgi:uncharacterized protein (DUF2235 family)
MDVAGPRNLVICFDGTNNQFGIENTSVVRIIQSMERDPLRQLLFYDPGVGTLPEPTRSTRIGKWLSKIAGLAFGQGLIGKVGEAYVYLMEHWRPGDTLFVFGFSRGSYSARTLAALLHMFGLLPSGAQALVPYVLRWFRTAGSVYQKSTDSRAQYEHFCHEFRDTFSQAIPGREERRFPVHFLGLFDTVSSVGWVWDPMVIPFTKSNPSVEIARHAIAIDERRCFFRQNTFGAVGGQRLDEQWFAGVHSDVGGGYPENSGGLWREAFSWMLEGATAAGLLIDDSRWQKVWRRTVPPDSPWLEPKHESLTKSWWLAEFFPKRVYDHRTWKKRFWPRIGRGRYRTIPDGARLHDSTLKRIRGDNRYNPPNLPSSLVAKIRSGEEVDPVVRLPS